GVRAQLPSPEGGGNPRIETASGNEREPRGSCHFNHADAARCSTKNAVLGLDGLSQWPCDLCGMQHTTSRAYQGAERALATVGHRHNRYLGRREDRSYTPCDSLSYGNRLH